MNRTHRTSLFLVLAAVATVSASGCSSRTVYVRDDGYAPLPPPPPPPSPPPQVVVVEQPALPEVVRADEIEAGHVAARVIHADVVVARSGHVGQIVEVNHPGQGRGQGRGGGRNRGDISAQEIIADEIHVNELRADHLEADIIYAERVIIGDAPTVAVRHRPERVRGERPRREQGSTVIVVDDRRRELPDQVRGRGRPDDRLARGDEAKGRARDHFGRPEKPALPAKPGKGWSGRRDGQGGQGQENGPGRRDDKGVKGHAPEQHGKPGKGNGPERHDDNASQGNGRERHDDAKQGNGPERHDDKGHQGNGGKSSNGAEHQDDKGAKGNGRSRK